MKSKVKVIRKPKKAISRLNHLSKNMSGPNKVRVGLPKDSNAYPDGTSVVMVGIVHEFGNPSNNIPQRSFIRTGIRENKRAYKRLFRSLTRKIIDGKMDKHTALELIGLQAQTDIRQKITDLKLPPLKNRQGNPLIDTGHMRQSVTYEVDKK